VRPLGEPAAHGLTSEVYAWDETRILKLFRDGLPSEQVAYEARIARAVHAAGLPVPAVGDIVEVDGRRGLLYERVDGLTMMDVIEGTVGQYPRPLACMLSYTPTCTLVGSCRSSHHNVQSWHGASGRPSCCQRTCGELFWWHWISCPTATSSVTAISGRATC